MVAKITFPKRVLDALNYNEQKVGKGVADLLYAHGYLRKADDLNFYQKLEGLELRNSLNEQAKTNTLHVSLNFSPADRMLDRYTLVRIAREYMQGIGFGSQPYLVYCHKDAGHPHLHIVSTTIRIDGSRIPTHNLGKEHSSKIRVALEQAYNLVPAKGRRLAAMPFPAFTPETAQYGKEETRRAIARIVSYVYRQYAYGSLPKYNAALRQFGVVADRGKEESRIYKHGGLVYRLLNEQGAKVGVPIKASLLPGKPTLSNLEQQFKSKTEKQERAKAFFLPRLDAAIQNSSTMQLLISTLAKQQVFVLLRQNGAGRIYGITFVDNRSHCVFNGSDLGKDYSAAALLAKLPQVSFDSKLHAIPSTSAQQHLCQNKSPDLDLNKPRKTLGDILSTPNQLQEATPPAVLTKKRKRKQRRTTNL